MDSYFRQYIATYNSKHEKEVWINFLCIDEKSLKKMAWKEKWIIVKDGGNSYFNLKINLSTGKIYNLMINGHV